MSFRRVPQYNVSCRTKETTLYTAKANGQRDCAKEANLAAKEANLIAEGAIIMAKVAKFVAKVAEIVARRQKWQLYN
jgi:hypothetical protein